MKNFKTHIILCNQTIKDALQKINSFFNENLTLLVVNEEDALVGTLTDGDIRRAFLSGAKLESKIKDYLFASFLYLDENNINIELIKKAKKKKIELLPIIDFNKKIIDVIDLIKQKSLISADAVLMAGGIGKRLLPLTANKPKPMLPLGNKPIIEYNIDRLISYGIKNIYISVNYLSEQIKEYFGDGSNKGISIKYIEEDRPLGTIGALRNVDNFENENVLLMNSDLFTNIDFETFYTNHIKEKAAITIASIPYTINVPYAILQKEGNVIKSFNEKPTYTKYANAGIYMIKKQFINVIPKNTFYNTTDLIEKVLYNKQKVIDSPIFGYWIDIGQHEDYQKAQELIKHLSND